MSIFWSELQTEISSSIQLLKTTIGYFVLVWPKVLGQICPVKQNEQS